MLDEFGQIAAIVSCIVMLLVYFGLDPRVIAARIRGQTSNSMTPAVASRNKLIFGLMAITWFWCGLTVYRLHSVSVGKTIPPLIVAWGGSDVGCNAAIDTSSFVAAANKYRMFLVCQILDASIDPMEDTRIAMSSPFHITGGILEIAIHYAETAPIRQIALPGTRTNLTVVLLPNGQDGSRIHRLSDVPRDSGILAIPGSKI